MPSAPYSEAVKALRERYQRARTAARERDRKRARARAHRAAGRSYAWIGRKLGVSRQRAHQLANGTARRSNDGSAG